MCHNHKLKGDLQSGQSLQLEAAFEVLAFSVPRLLPNLQTLHV